MRVGSLRVDILKRHAARSEPADPLAKLAPSLKGLAARVEKEGKEGNLSADGLTVSNHLVDVMVYLSDTSAETFKAITDLGFTKTGESKAVRLLVGTLDVRKLEALAKLDAVVKVEPLRLAGDAPEVFNK
jgi:hypothetical protein